MASSRILGIRKDGPHPDKLHLKMPKKYLLLAIAAVLTVMGCGTSGSVRKAPFPSEPNKTKESGVSEEFKETLNENRSELDDVFSGENEVPEYFHQKNESKAEESRSIGNPYTGFRVQIISTRDRSKAESVASEFRFWADNHIVGYFPEAYVTFDQPYYKVHVGNFQFQKKAVKFTQLIKTKYHGAWVVHDRIEPEGVPSGDIRLLKKTNQ